MSFFSKCVNVSIAAFLISGLSMTFGATSVSAVGLDDVCDQFNAADRVLVVEDTLFSDTLEGATIGRDLTTPIPAGVYDISALSYEPQHPNDPIPGQTEEYWFVSLYNGADVVFTSPTTIDIPDADQITITNFGNSVELTSNVDRIVYTHAGYPEADENNVIYNSVVPACVGFTEIEPVVAPVCTVAVAVDSANSMKANVEITHESDSQDVSYVINWGDDSAEETFVAGDTPMHIYAVAGDYDVTVSVYVGAELVTTCDNSITVSEEPVDEPAVLGIGTSEEQEPEVAVADTPQSTGQVLANTGAPGSVSFVVGVIVMMATAAVSYIGRRSTVS